MKRQSFMQGAMIMMVSAIVVKIAGALFKIPLSSILGGGGMGYFMVAYGVFNPVYALCAAGISPAVTAKISRVSALKGEDEGVKLSGMNIVFFYSLWNTGLCCFLLPCTFYLSHFR